MRNSFFYAVFVNFIFIFPVGVSAQSIFSQIDLEYKKTFLPYDVPYTFALEDKEFVMLQELKKNTMKLGRYDQYFFSKWEKQLEFDENESTPQLFLKGDSIVAYSFTIDLNKKQSRLSFRYFDVKSGNELPATNYVFAMVSNEDFSPVISFNDNQSKFAVYNYLVDKDGLNKVEFQVFDIGTESPSFQHHLDPEKLGTTKSSKIHLSNNGDLFLVVVEASEFKAETYFWNSKNSELSQVNSNFFFERPLDQIGDISIVKQGASSYFVSFSAQIEDELIGFGTLGVNVILKTVMFSYNQNFTKPEIQEVYDSYYFTSKDQKKKHLAIPEMLEHFRLVDNVVNTQQDIILIFEELEIPIEYHSTGTSTNMTWKHKSKEDKFYFGGDLLVYSFSESGELKWKKSIQKSQFSQGNGLGLSFISKMNQDQLRLLMYESSKGGNFYIMDLDTSNGSLIKTINLMPEKKFEFTKKYSTWLDDNSVVICGIAPNNINKRSLMLVEF